MRKRNIKTKQQKYKGSITIFAALSFMLIAQFIFTMLEVSRTIEVRKTLQMNTESVLESIFANYCSPLWEEYRLLGTSVVNSDGDLSFNNVQAQLQNLTDVNLGGREKSLLAGTSMLTAKMTDANFEEFLLMTDDNGAVFQEVVCAYMKENFTYETARTIYDNLNDMKNAKDQYGDAGNSIDTARDSINEAREEIEYEFDFLCNNLPVGEGLLIGESPKLCKGKRYSEDDKIIKGISVCSASSINDTVVMYSISNKNVMNDGSIGGLKGIVFCNERMVIAPTYIDVKSINSELLFIQNERGLVGIRNVTKELLEPQFSLIINPYNNIAIGFKIKYVEEDDIYQCQCCLLKFNKDAICQEDVVKITGSQLYELLCPTFESLDGWETLVTSEEHKILIAQYWKHISHDNNDTNRFWYPYYKDFKYLWEDEHYEEVREGMSDDSADSYDWRYYNDGLDMDQQDERFWNF